MHFRDGRGVGDGPAKFNFADVLTSKEFVEFGPEHESLSIAQYRQLVEQKVNELTANNPILQKIRDSLPVSEEEAEILAAQLHDEHPHIKVELLRLVYQHQKAPFLRFIRHILGSRFSKAFQTQCLVRSIGSLSSIPSSPDTSFRSSTSSATTSFTAEALRSAT